MSSGVAVVTGAAGGLGSAITGGLLEEGYRVAVVDIDADALERLADSFQRHPDLASFVTDVTSAESVQRTATAIVDKWGLDIAVLVNNAGVLDRTYCVNDESQVRAIQVINVNLIGAFICTGAFSRYMVRRRQGRVINIASVAGIWGSGGSAAYAASKAGLIKASESWAQELGQFNISVTAVAPGICMTSMSRSFETQGVTDKAIDQRIVRSLVPVGRWGTPDDVAEVVKFLATCKTNYLNATVIPLDGGMRVGAL